MAGTRRTSRRGLILGALALAGVAWGWQRFGVSARVPEYAPIPGLPGWRQMSFEGLSSAGGNATNAALIGIDDGTAPIEPLPVKQLCEVLFNGVPDGKIPVAAFSDFFCPYCRRLNARLWDRASASGSAIDLTWHELPLLGRASEIAARAGIAADLQDGYSGFQRRLMNSSFRPSPAFLGDVARASGLDAERLLQDMDSPVVAERLGQSRAAAERLGIFGTPALVVGRTLVMGEIGDTALDRLIADSAGAECGFR